MSPTTSRKSTAGNLLRKRKEKKSIESKIGLQFRVSRFKRHLRRGRYAKRISAGSAVYLTAAIEYLVAEVLEVAGHMAVHHKKKRIIPRHIKLAISEDEELDQLLSNVVIAEGGVRPMLIPLRRMITTAKNTK